MKGPLVETARRELGGLSAFEFFARRQARISFAPFAGDKLIMNIEILNPARHVDHEVLPLKVGEIDMALLAMAVAVARLERAGK